MNLIKKGRGIRPVETLATIHENEKVLIPAPTYVVGKMRTDVKYNLFGIFPRGFFVLKNYL